MVSRRRAVAAGMVAAALLCAGLARGESAEASAPVSSRIVVVGDSITANYNHRSGDALQGWWSMVARHFDADISLFAQSGSGFVRSGERCTGNRFIDRAAVFQRKRPALFLVEGGRNDWAYCYDGNHVSAPSVMIARSVAAYLDALMRSVPEGSRIVVVGPPWGPAQRGDAARVTEVIATAAAERDLTYVDTAGTIDSADRVIDGVHPNRAGSEAIAAAVIDALEP